MYAVGYLCNISPVFPSAIVSVSSPPVGPDKPTISNTSSLFELTKTAEEYHPPPSIEAPPRNNILLTIPPIITIADARYIYLDVFFVP